MSSIGRPASIILAGGASRRMGSPKALLLYRGETFLDRLIRIHAAVAHPVVVVLGHNAALVRSGLTRAGQAAIVVNPDPERGQLSSFHCALAVLDTTATRAFLFTPVDYPAVEQETIERLVAAYEGRQTGQMLAIPRYGGRHGHPVCAHASLIGELLALPADSGQARHVIHRHRPQTLFVDVDDPGVVNDVDVPGDYERLVASAASEGGRPA